MNITIQDRIIHTIARAETRLDENKKAIKTYKSEATARIAADKLSNNLADYWEVQNAPVYVLPIRHESFSGVRYLLAVDVQAIQALSKNGGYMFAYLDGQWTLSNESMVANAFGKAA